MALPTPQRVLPGVLGTEVNEQHAWPSRLTEPPNQTSKDQDHCERAGICIASPAGPHAAPDGALTKPTEPRVLGAAASGGIGAWHRGRACWLGRQACSRLDKRSAVSLRADPAPRRRYASASRWC